MSSMLIFAGSAWYTDSRFWILVPLIIFFAFLINKGVHKAMFASLDGRAEKIQSDLDEARRLREEAQALLASYHRKQKEAEQQAEDIVKQARHDAEVMAANARKDLAERLERRTAQAEAKIANAEAQALVEIKARAADMAVDAAEQILGNKLTAAEQTKLIKDGLSQMGKSFS